MRPTLLIRLAGATALAAACAQAASATPPALVAKRAQARHVLQQIAVIDERLNGVVESYDGARIRLDALHGRLKSEQVSLVRARARYHRAQQREASLLVWLYTSNRPTALDVILGAHSLSELISLSSAEDAIGRQTAEVAASAADARTRLETAVHRLAGDQASAGATVHELARQRAVIQHGLAQSRQLLASVQAQVAQMEAAERARQARLAAEARARLAAEAAARARLAAERAAQARRAAAAAAQAREAAVARAAAATRAAAAKTATVTTTASTTTTAATTTTTATTPTTVSTPAATTAATVTTTPAPAAPAATTTTTSAAPAIVPTGPLPSGHPQAAQVALQYIGVPYLWAGSSPSGFDCSGLVTYVYAQLGIQLPHFAAAQWVFGVPVPKDQLQAGDLVFFDGLNHVGIAIGNGLFVDAPHTNAYVRIESLNDPWYSTHYVGAKRI